MGPFLATLFIAMFFLLMQFVWRYIDDLMGKGLGPGVISEFLFYVCINIMPMALPLAILLSSIMTFGALAESNEMTAMKSAGLSLFKIIRPITYFIIALAIGAFFFANYALPWSNLKWKTLYWEILESKPAFQLSEKMFYNEIPQTTMRVNKKDADGKSFKDILIYDYGSGHDYRKRDVRSEKGEIRKSKNPNYMLLNLKKGVIYEEETNSKLKGAVFPFRTTIFDEANLKFDVSGFKLSRGDEGLFKDSYEMLNIFQINAVTDSLETALKERGKSYKMNLINRYSYFRERMKLPEAEQRKKDSIDMRTTETYAALYNHANGNNVPVNNLNAAAANSRYQPAIDLCVNSITTIENAIAETSMRNEALVRYNIEWHRKFVLAFACIVIFFIGAPLGAIVRKGGLGTPMVISVLLFLLYHILMMTGEKMAKSGTVTPATGMWFSAFILTPIAFLITWLAAKESNLAGFKRIFGRIWKFLKFWQWAAEVAVETAD
jgi:lipopolysaccharide export system permease protein